MLRRPHDHAPRLGPAVLLLLRVPDHDTDIPAVTHLSLLAAAYARIDAATPTPTVVTADDAAILRTAAAVLTHHGYWLLARQLRDLAEGTPR